jgi:hypothetical protein
MSGLNKFGDKDKRRERLRNHIAKDLHSPKYHQRIVERRRVEGEDGELYFLDRYYDEEDD